MPAIESPVANKTRSIHSSPPATLDLSEYGITVQDIQRNLSPALLYIEAIQGDDKCTIADTGGSYRVLGRENRSLADG